jgi:TRAP-type C4-dicarboxylate transport system substrate-binding protein
MSPPGSNNVVKFWNPWVERFNKAGEGVVVADLRHGVTLANFGNIYDRVVSDVVQVGWCLMAALAGKFPLSEVVTLPFLTDNNVDASVALWRLYKSGALDEEMKEIVPLWFTAGGGQSFHFAKAPRTAGDLSGLKINVTGGKLFSDAVTQLGGTPITLPASDVYEGLQRRTIDGALMGWPAFGPYKLAEVTTYHIEVPFGASAHMIFMSKRKYQSLPGSVRTLIDRHSGESMTREFALYFKGEEMAQRTHVADSNTQKIVALTPEQEASWRTKVDVVVKSWLSSAPGRNEIFQTYSRLLSELRGG